MIRQSTLALAGALALLSGTALASGSDNASGTQSHSTSSDVSASADANKDNRMDTSMRIAEPGEVTIHGTVTRIINNDEFELSYGGGNIKVDTNDAWPNLFKKDANMATRQLQTGDRVAVTGKIDNNNLFDKREIDAYSLRHENGGQIFSYEPGNKTRKSASSNY